jgi:hypothetical protein
MQMVPDSLSLFSYHIRWESFCLSRMTIIIPKKLKHTALFRCNKHASKLLAFQLTAHLIELFALFAISARCTAFGTKTIIGRQVKCYVFFSSALLISASILRQR